MYRAETKERRYLPCGRSLRGKDKKCKKYVLNTGTQERRINAESAGKPLDELCLILYNYLCMNFNSKGDDGDSRSYPNIPASREGCEHGISRIFPNITPEPQPPTHTEEP